MSSVHDTITRTTERNAMMIDTGAPVMADTTATQAQTATSFAAQVMATDAVSYRFGTTVIQLPDVEALLRARSANPLAAAVDIDVARLNQIHSLLLVAEKRYATEQANDPNAIILIDLTEHARQLQQLFIQNADYINGRQPSFLRYFDETTIMQSLTSVARPIHEPVHRGRFEKKRAKKQAKARVERQYNQIKGLGVQYTDNLNRDEHVVVDHTLLDSEYVYDFLMEENVTVYDQNGPDSLSKSTLSKKEILNLVRENHDYRYLEHLDMPVRFMLAAEYAKDITFDGNVPDMARKLKTAPYGGHMNPLLRIAISLGMRGALAGVNWSRENFRKLDEYINTSQVVKTIAVHNDDNPPENVQAQKLLLRTMMLCHLGDIKLLENKRPKVYSGTVANLFTHCSRVGFSFNNSVSELVGAKTDGGYASGLRTRTAATHSVKRASKHDSSQQFKEIKTSSKLRDMPKAFFHQYGMNIAAGGYNSDGIWGQQGPREITNDGSCGHIYMHIEDQDQDHKSGMLIGIESDTPGHINQTGHKHGASATPDSVSTFGGQRIDEIGDKYDGRTIDVNYVGPGEMSIILNALEAKFSRLQDDGDSAGLTALATKICGNKMKVAELRAFVQNDLGIDLSTIAFFEQMTDPNIHAQYVRSGRRQRED